MIELVKRTCATSGGNNLLVVVTKEAGTAAEWVRVRIDVELVHHAVHLVGSARPSSWHECVARERIYHSNLQAQG